MKKIILTTALFILIHLGVNNSFACTCVETNFSEGFENSEAVFTGQVIETGGIFDPYATFKVEKAWKGVASDEIIININTHCGGTDFKNGEQYLVYAYEQDGYLYAHGCSRTTTLINAENDLKALESKNTIHLSKTVLNKNLTIYLATGVFVLMFVGLGLLLMKYRKS